VGGAPEEDENTKLINNFKKSIILESAKERERRIQQFGMK
jgi:hypothetical protein